MAIDLSALLSRSANEITPPKMIPPGQYLFHVTAVDSSKRTQTTDNPMVVFSVQAVAPIEVDSSTLEGVNFPVRMQHRFIVTEASLFRLKNFMLHLGFSDDGESLQSMIDTSIGRAFRGTIVHLPDNRDAAVMRAEIRETFTA